MCGVCVCYCVYVICTGMSEVWPNDQPAIFKKSEKKIVIILGFVQAMNTIITMNTFETKEA